MAKQVFTVVQQLFGGNVAVAMVTGQQQLPIAPVQGLSLAYKQGRLAFYNMPDGNLLQVVTTAYGTYNTATWRKL